MTLIATTLTNNIPFLIGDILITSNQKGDETKLPKYLRGIEKYFPEAELFPVLFRQKIYVLHDRLCIGFAGDLYSIKYLLEDIRMHFSYTNPSIESVSAFVKLYDSDSNFDGVSFLIIFINQEDDRVYYCRKGSWVMANSPLFGETLAIGSGQNDFLKRINDGFTINHQMESKNFYQAISLNYIALANVLGYERLSLDSIQKHWGAGFEMIFYNGNKFSKIDDITYVIWRGKYDSSAKKVESSPFLFLNYKYFDDILLVSSFDGNEFHMQAVLPIYKTPQDIDMNQMPSKPHFDSKKVCAIYLIEFPDGRIFSPAFFSQASDNKDDFPIIRVYFDEKDHLAIMIQSDFQDALNEQFKNYAEQFD